MTTTTEMREALTAISTQLANAVTGAAQSELPHATLVASIDQIRGFVNAMANSVTDEPAAGVGELVQAPGIVLDCAVCIQDARNREAMGEIALPVLRARTVINGLAFCDDRHKIVTPMQHAAQQAGGIIVPGQGGPMPGPFGPINGQG